MRHASFHMSRIAARKLRSQCVQQLARSTLVYPRQYQAGRPRYVDLADDNFLANEGLLQGEHVLLAPWSTGRSYSGTPIGDASERQVLVGKTLSTRCTGTLDMVGPVLSMVV
jgi:hypothetical protein